MKISQLSTFFPAYNEEENIASTIQKADEALKGLNLKDYEIIIINDGSKDRTLEVIEGLKKKFSYLKIINHQPNQGYGAALKSGFYNAKYPWITFTDSDGQFDFSEISNFINKQEQLQADLVIGYYKERKVSFFTKLTSKIWEMVVFLLFGLKVRDIDCAFKLISKRVIDTIPKLESARGAFISSELLIKAQRKGFKIAEVGVSHYERKIGKGTGRSLKVIIKSFLDLLQLWWKLH